ncbi:CRISPR-associated helicase Cas3' [Peptoclostridium sp. AF21-18]|uniref:CRISPR-associated helicase Cas3' n=1 Tax=Peptoclostridium sp. AF21-18 TaxID=2292243 RepID=UPI000E53A787|nr:CRISPR-associated helicase Cas3' [Peptoclostridium sp. AF21-18]RHQ95186.1 CRISPR-associated helicase Cas3' [Peptoclostridium sp. AF21-18]
MDINVRINEILENDIIREIENKLAKPDKTIKEHTMDLIEELNKLKKLGYISDAKLFSLVEKGCIYHDIGKINKEFQKRIERSNDKKVKFNDEKEVAHNILSIYFIDDKKFSDINDYLKVLHSVLNHHNYCNTFEVMRDKKELISELLEGYNTKKIKKSIENKIAEIIEDNESIKIKGYLHKCDYNASAGTVSEYPNNFLEESLNNMMQEWKKSNSESDWNELQKFCIENRDENIIAVAQTGMGKTEAGLLWIGDNKGFFILPLRTAINAIYDRVRKNIIHEKDLEHRLSILHSSSLEYYLNNLENKKVDENFDLLEYENVGKQLSIPLNISTMDQLFDFVFKYQGYELKLTTLSYSKIVIDEIQMYSPELLAYLICGIEKIVELGGKVAILTATLPPFIKDLLEKNIEFKYNPNGFTNDLKRHNLKVIEEEINPDDIYEKYIENKNADRENKILVVCNTIKQAQNIYDDLAKMLSEKDRKNLNILHSRFIRKDRLEKEESILEFGRTYDENKNIDKKNGIWISTSIVEASLDIDFDYLFTELQDLNSLFQRLGRCNRKGKKDSSKHNCFVYTEIKSSTLRDNKHGFIDKRVYELSKSAILSIKEKGQIYEKEKIALINDYLTTDNLRSSDYIKAYDKEYDYVKKLTPYTISKDEIELRNINTIDIIPSPVYETNIEDIKNFENKLKEISDRLKEKGIDLKIRDDLKKEKIILKDAIKKYTVSIPYYEVDLYKNAIKNGNAIKYNPIRLSEFETIDIIDCDYDEKGYQNKNYTDRKSKQEDYML